MKKLILLIITTILPLALYSQQKGFKLNEQEYFENGGVNVMAFQDIYPEGHQGGVADNNARHENSHQWRPAAR